MPTDTQEQRTRAIGLYVALTLAEDRLMRRVRLCDAEIKELSSSGGVSAESLAKISQGIREALILGKAYEEAVCVVRDLRDRLARVRIEADAIPDTLVDAGVEAIHRAITERGDEVFTLEDQVRVTVAALLAQFPEPGPLSNTHGKEQ